MNILVTGGAGYIGSVLVDYLLNLEELHIDHITVVDDLIYDNQTALYKHCLDKRFRFIKYDLRKLVDPILGCEFEKLVFDRKYDFIFPLAALVGFPTCEKEQKAAWEINYRHVSWLCNDDDAKFIISTTNSGYGIGGNGFCTEESPINPISVYGRTKMSAEKEILQKKGISLRLATVFGPSFRPRTDLLVNDFVYKAVNNEPIVLFEAHFRRNYIHVLDVCRAFVHCMFDYDNMKGQAYNVGLSSANLTKLQLAEKIKEHIPSFKIILSDISSDPDKRDYLVSNEKFEKTGWHPMYTLDDGIKQLINLYSVMQMDSRWRNY